MIGLLMGGGGGGVFIVGLYGWALWLDFIKYSSREHYRQDTM